MSLQPFKEAEGRKDETAELEETISYCFSLGRSQQSLARRVKHMFGVDLESHCAAFLRM